MLTNISADKKLWKKRNLTDLARAFELRNMEKEAYMITSVSKCVSNVLHHQLISNTHAAKKADS